MSPTISAVIIALNEEQNLPGLLERLDWTDEVIVVDGGSSDGTVAIARSWGARVLVRSFDNFAAQRNYGLALARGDWILSIDADERPAAGLKEEVRERIATSRLAAFRVPIRSKIFGRRFRFNGTQDDRPVRLVRRGAARWAGGVHEVLQVAGRVGRLRRALEHETIPNLAAFLTKMERYTTLAAAQRIAAGQLPRKWNRWLAPPREVFRRLVWKQGFFDGPQGWAFALLSGVSEWILADKHRRMWDEAQVRNAGCRVRSDVRPRSLACAYPPARPARPAIRAANSAIRNPQSAIPV
jgi:hypothetical protein